MKQIGREMGVQYVLEGSVRREGNRIRITAQLIDALTGHHIFSERYDRELKEIFATQEELAIRILTALRVALKDGQWARIQARGVSNVEAYFKLQEAFELTLTVNKDSNAQARRLVEEALALEPGSSRAYQILAMTYFWDFWLGSPISPEESIALGIEMANRAIALDQGNSVAHGTVAMLYVNSGEYDKAIEQAERAVSLDPDSIQVLIQYGSILMHACRPAEAIPAFEKVLRLDPVKPGSMSLSNLASCYRMIGRYEDSVRLYKRLLGENPKHWSGHVGLTITYSVMGREEEARAQANELLKADPKFFVERYRRTARWKDPVEMNRNLDALRKAGLK
ncbi:MAG: adenylyl cyclase class-3/4/guanylyl cyclase [Deltaproteobacteria bacterium]|nr:adenylyl cyclase class-3/4/guanylyl cyclase [Deltaproteobacteria bacterium]